MVISSRVKITCYFHLWRYEVFARKFTWCLTGVWYNEITYSHCCFSLVNRDFKIRVQVRDGVELRLFFPSVQVSNCYNPRLLLKSIYFRPSHAPLVSFRGFKKWSRDDELWVSLCHGESCFTVCLQLCWVLHFLTRYDPRYVTEKSLTNAKSIAWLRLCLELAAFEEFANALLKTVAIRAKRCLSSHDLFF